MDFMRDVPDKAYELAIVDVPYGINIGGESGGGNWERQAVWKAGF